MDIWQTGSGSSEILYTGWLGRYLDNNCKSSYEAIETDDVLSLALKGKNLNGMAVKEIYTQLYNETNTPYFNDLTNAIQESALNEDNQGYLYKTLIETQSSLRYIHAQNKVSPFSATYPTSE